MLGFALNLSVGDISEDVPGLKRQAELTKWYSFVVDDMEEDCKTLLEQAGQALDRILRSPAEANCSGSGTATTPTSSAAFTGSWPNWMRPEHRARWRRSSCPVWSLEQVEPSGPGEAGEK